MPAAPPNAPSGSPDDTPSPWTGPTQGGVEYTSDASPVPLRIGRYTIVKLIGSGGMGAVYEAEQAQPKRRVALKLIRQAFAGESARIRFQQEAQHLAELDHPAIAKVFEAGSQTQDIGGPIAFIAMEYVHGAEAITRFARKRNLPLHERLELVAQVCDALHHAHERGIIHRDIKPANVVVSESGQPKVIDFGVARAELLAGERRPGVTLDGQMIGTLEYMAPEQCLADPNDPNAIDRRTDVYALGLLLYELVVGFMPYDVSRADIPTAINVIRETPPEPPRKSNPDLPREVETIMLKALRKERGDRYSSALALGDDIRRYLRDEAIHAKQQSLAEHAERIARKTARSRPVLVLVLDVLLAASVAWLIAFPLAVYTPVAHWYSAALSRATPRAAESAELTSDIAIIARTDAGHDGAELAAQLGVNGFDPAVKQSWRLLHAKLMDRLLDAKPKSVCYDMHFPAESPFDQSFADSAQRLKAAGIPVFVTIVDYSLRADGTPMVAPTILPQIRWGAARAAPGSEGLWGIDLAARSEASPLFTSWALEVFAHMRCPDAEPEFSILNEDLLEVRWITHPAGIKTVKKDARDPEFFPVLASHANTVDFPGLSDRDLVFTMLFRPLDPGAFDGRVTPYEAAFDLPSQKFSALFHDKHVVIANFSDGKDIHAGQVGPPQPGATYQLGALNTLLSNTPLRWLSFLGSLLLPAIVALALAVASFACFRRSKPTVLRTTLILLGLTIVLVAGSFLFYARFRMAFEPFTPWAAGVFACFGMAALTTIRSRRAA